MTQSQTICSFLCILLATPAQAAFQATPNPLERAPGIRQDLKKQRAHTIALQLSSLERIYVQPLRLQDSGGCGTGAFRQFMMKAGLRVIARTSTKREGLRKLFVLPDSLSYEHDEAHKHRLVLVEGVDGPWQERSTDSDFTRDFARPAQLERRGVDDAVESGYRPGEDQSTDSLSGRPRARRSEQRDLDRVPPGRRRLPISPPSVRSSQNE